MPVLLRRFYLKLPTSLIKIGSKGVFGGKNWKGLYKKAHIILKLLPWLEAEICVGLKSKIQIIMSIFHLGN